MFVANFEFNGVLAVSRIIENVHILRGIAVEDCSVVIIFMFLKVFCGSMSVVGILETETFVVAINSYGVTATLS